MKPFLKWAGGKRWLVHREEFDQPDFAGRYIEPFLGGGSVFFHIAPEKAVISDKNDRLIESYTAIRDDWRSVVSELIRHQSLHNREYYYSERSRIYDSAVLRAAQFIYLNRTCWNGLYRENTQGGFNVPIGTKTSVIYDDDDFEGIADRLAGIEINCCDFEETISRAKSGDFIFVDPPYTTAHNMNGFVKYNQNIFKWEDQVRLSLALKDASRRGCDILVTNAAHDSIRDLYSGSATIQNISRHSVISGRSTGRRGTVESIIRFPSMGEI